MSGKIKDGGPAFPATEMHEYFGDHAYTGMSLRDWFAGQALVSVAASIIEAGMDDGAPAQEVAKIIVSVSFGVADAMLAARENEK